MAVFGKSQMLEVSLDRCSLDYKAQVLFFFVVVVGFVCIRIVKAFLKEKFPK